MDKTSLELQTFQSEVDRVLLSMMQSGAIVCRSRTTCFITAGTTCTHTTHGETDILPLSVRPAVTSLRRMLQVTQLESTQRHELENLDLRVHCLVHWYQHKKSALCSAPNLKAVGKLQCFFRHYAVELADQIQAYWVILEPQVKQHEQAECQRYVLKQKQEQLARLLELEPDNEEWLAVLSRLSSRAQPGPVHRAYLSQTYERTLQRRAQEIANRADILSLLTLHLQSVPDDVFQVAKIITPILAVLAITETVAIPLVPALFASIALILWRRLAMSRYTDYDNWLAPDSTILHAALPTRMPPITHRHAANTAQ